MRFSVPLLLASALCFGPVVDVSAQEPIHSAEVGDYVVKWHRVNRGHDIGDVVDIYEPADDNSKTVRMKRVYEYFDSTFVDSVAAWAAPTDAYPSIRGVLLTTGFSTGSGKTFLIFAETKKGFRKVFDVFTDRNGDAHPLEMVDLDGDGLPEIVSVPSFTSFIEHGPGTTRAQVWKWSKSRERYRMVRESAYLDRLKPLTAKAATKRPARRRRKRAVPAAVIRVNMAGSHFAGD